MKRINLINYSSRLLLSCLLILSAGCQPEASQKYQLKRFEKDLFNSPETKLELKIDQLSSEYPSFFSIFTEHIIGIGPATDPNIEEYLKQFTQDPVIKEVYQKTQDVFPDFEFYASRINEGLEKYEKLKGSNVRVSLTTFISGFNQSFVSLENELAIGIDNFLGSDCLYYKQLGLPAYIIARMEPESLVADATRAWIQSDLEGSSDNQSLLDYIIFQGKILYASLKVLDKAQELNTFGYNPEQLKWCRNHEKSMWEFLVEQNMLFSTDALMIQRLSKEAPFTRDFGLDSPPRAGAWLGYRIVEKFMSRNKASFNDLLFKLTAKEILAQSGYRP